MRFIRSSKILAFSLFSFGLHAEQYIVEKSSTATTFSAPPALKILRRFEAFGKNFEVVDASPEILARAEVQVFTKRAWKHAEPSHTYHLYISPVEAAAEEFDPVPGASKPDLSDFDPKPTLPNDTLFLQQWGFLNYGQSAPFKGKRHADSGIAQAWTLHTGSDRVTVATVDTGVDYNHPDLRSNLWSATIDGKTAFGYNALDKNNDPQDGYGHGTHVAGTIGAVGNNGQGVAGVNWKTRIAAVRIFGSSGETSTDAILMGLDWVYKHRDEVRVVNNSWGGPDYSPLIFDAFQRLDDEGIIQVIAAGNDSKRLHAGDAGKSGKGEYPAMFPLKNSIVVASYSNDGKRSMFSNYGPDVVDIAAPGESIYSTMPDGKYGLMSGTSMATPHVVGAVALLMSYRPELSAKQVREWILNYADQVPALRSTSEKGRRLNVYRALLGH